MIRIKVGDCVIHTNREGLKQFNKVVMEELKKVVKDEVPKYINDPRKAKRRR